MLNNLDEDCPKYGYKPRVVGVHDLRNSSRSKPACASMVRLAHQSALLSDHGGQASRGLTDCARCRRQAPLQEMTRKKRMLIYNPEPRVFCT